ncbi:MAG: T9SS type A sorting domain-containing protein, partial [Parabacteroides sp.]|nr:T9SS type A sorting domain-containing protein [Parabacteroides sp.]
TFVPENCKVVVTDASGKEYATGDVVAKGAVLTIKATPFTDCEMKTFTVNGKPFTSGSTYTVTDETVEIVAIAQLKDVNPESVVITLPENDEVQGAILTKTGAQEVAFNGELTFSVATLAADKNKVSVTANGVTLKPNSNGVYTVKADKNKTVSVSVANPTAIVVKADTTLSPGLKPMGKVEIQGWTSTKKYYYGDVVTVTAFPESGVTFVGWKGFTDDSNPLEVILKEPSYTFKALYKGTPTGIEDIMAASIATGKGCVWVRGIANADVTIVSISGRVQARQRISGDTRIDVPAGIYVVVLESGSDVKRVKVIVK